MHKKSLSRFFVLALVAMALMMLVGSVVAETNGVDAIAAPSAPTLLFDRGLPADNLNNDAGIDRSNVSWGSTPGGEFVGDDFSIGAAGETYRIDSLTVWGAQVDPLGDDISDITLWIGKATDASLTPISTGNVTGNSNDNPNISHTFVTYADGSSYVGNGNIVYPIAQTTFSNLNLTIEGGTLYYFGIAANGPIGWYGHASNAALGGVPADGADDLYREFSAAGVFLNTVDSNGNGWDKSSDINVQITGEELEPPCGELDYSLGFYISDNTKANYVEYTYVNTGSTTITDLAGTFDLESPWSRENNDKPRTGGFNKGLRYQTTVSGSPSGFSSNIAGVTLQVDNSLVVSSATTWYDEATMDSLGLSIRNVAFSISGLALENGDSITLRWDESVSAIANQKNMLVSVDNFVLNDVSGGGSVQLYAEDFDAAGEAALSNVGAGNTDAAPVGWTVYANGADVSGTMTVSDGTSAVWGGVYTGYYATAEDPCPAVTPTGDTVVCDAGTVNIVIDDVENLYGYEFVVDYSNGVGEVEAVGDFVNDWFDPDTPGDPDDPYGFPGPGWDAVCDDVIGECKFAYTRGNPLGELATTDPQVIAKIDFTSILASPSSPAQFDVIVKNVKLTDKDSFAIPGAVGGSLKVDVCGTATVSGQINLQGRPQPGQTAISGSPSVFEVSMTGPYGTFPGVVSDIDGTYTVSGVKYTTGGTLYDILADHSVYLPAADIGFTVSGDLSGKSTRLLGGDATADNEVSMGDITCINGAFGGASPGFGTCGTGPTGTPDVNDDGIVNIQDLALAAGNYEIQNISPNPQPW